MLKETNENTEDNCFRLIVKLRWMHSMFPRKEGSDNINESLQKIKQKKKSLQCPLFHIFLHKFLVELRPQCVIHKAFLFPCLIYSFGTILEQNIVIPP